MFWDISCLSHLHQGSCLGQDKFAASVVLEGLCPQRVAVNIVNDHDVLVAKAGDLREMPVIGHGIGGKVIPAKMAQLAENQLLE